jgi:hypothetical protein
MACPNCNSNPDMMIPGQVPEAPVPVRATTKLTVLGVNGQPYALNQPLVPSGHFPRGLWAAEVTVKGIARRVDKPTCIEVFNEAMRLFSLNDGEFWFVNIWLNLNLQWIPRVAPKHQIVTVAALEAISQPVT